MGFLVLTCGVCSIVFGSIIPLIGVVFNQVNVLLTAALMAFIDLCIGTSRKPFSDTTDPGVVRVGFLLQPAGAQQVEEAGES